MNAYFARGVGNWDLIKRTPPTPSLREGLLFKQTNKQSLKILGFNSNNRPDASHHVSLVIEKFYARLWTLRFLKRSGMTKDDLLKVYKGLSSLPLSTVK